MTRPAGREAVPITVPPAEKLPEVRAGRKCSCWPGQGGILGLGRPPCTAATCDPACKACAAAERPFWTREDLRFLEAGTGPLAAELARLWAAKDQPKMSTVGRREPPPVCARGHPREPGRVGPGRNCKACSRDQRRAARARAREAATA